MEELLSLLDEEIQDPEEECFLLFSNKPNNRDLGFVSRTESTVSVAINSQDFTIHQSPSLLASTREAGTTGAVLWKVTPLLASWLTHPSNQAAQHLLKSTSNVLELGAGTSGVLALSLASMVANYFATDQEYCLKLLRKNISGNYTEKPIRAKGGRKTKRNTEDSQTNITVLPLDWQLTESSSVPDIKDKRINLVLAADCIYNESLVDPLVDTMVDLCELNRDSNDTICLVAQELRSPDVLDAFMKAFCAKFQTWRVPDGLYRDCGDGGRGLVEGGGAVGMRRSIAISAIVRSNIGRGLLRAHIRIPFPGIRYQSTTPAKSRPLAGIRVLDLTRVLAGPYCTQILGDLGADVIKVEHATRGDDTRAWGPPFAPRKDGKPGPGESAYFLAVNRNKRSLGLDFKTTSGQAILKSLANTSDILVENYLPGTLAKYGLDYESLKAENKGLIYASITGYGQTGPYSARAGYDVMVEAEMGLMHITGERGGPPVKVGVAVTDLTTGLYTSNAILAALFSRNLTSQGQHIDMSLSDCQVATLANIASSVLVSGQRDAGRWGTAHPSIVPYEAFPTSDGSILLGGGNDRLFGILCKRIGFPEWAVDEKFVTNDKRVEHRRTLVPMIGDETRKKTTKEWLDIFEGSGMPYAAVNDVHDTLTHKHVLARGMVQEVHHEACGPVKLVNTPFKFSDAEASIRHAPPTLGQNTDDILQELGFTANQIDDLKIEGIVA
ncbi:hypothetical protein H072_6185 [Dactylellina haptotyla CBS 200.50]|uniref:Uncharacterized protein n=1 Tax=Dactylellina haptotyla (strain CBS 200.50) TaxID=1284197 RepID=S8AFS2_DACHA|nr:hypothetical protein H072_6185 [Dactylellina haptotyla CBS 200.50]